MASFGEQLLEAGRRNNTELLLDIRAKINDEPKLADLINSTTEQITDNSSLHLACHSGNWEFIDIVLDVEGVEIDPQNREGQTPLHVIVKYCAEEFDHGKFICDNMLDAGADPRITDKHGRKPIDLVTDDMDPSLRELLESAEYAIGMEIPQDGDFEGGEEEEGDEEEGDPTDSE
ncbi:hypothetical protein DIURU_002193 [Diutina rugosa]|uniref:Ankyrin repeat-containing protein n=1 Tax=Diutina rugosa TaxID=5481 RepID=A0A642UQI1_DIURU|nr:uncharacterized protein DIURU_002193 [Diutina rugosa]KAA8903682.1 hypothetical protein DIURU_002193 [Diutina rugosa]